MSNILEHNIERFGMVTVLDVVLYEVNGTEPKLVLDTLKMTNIAVEGSAKEIRGGIGNDMLINYDFGRTANIEIQDALVSPDSLAFLWGTKTGAATATEYQVVETYSTNASGALTFSYLAESANLPVAQDDIYVLKADGSQRKLLADIAINTTSGIATVTFASDPEFVADPSGLTQITKFDDSASYKIFFKRLSAVGKKIVLKNDNFPSAVKMIGTTFVIDEATGKKKLIQIEIPKFKINSNFSFTMDAEGDASVFDFSGVALASGGELIKLSYLGNY